jgi:uncharacterized protein
MNAALHPSLNVMGGELDKCSSAPRTGFFRNGCCDTSDDDHGCHTVCSIMTVEFLAFSKLRGNDLSTPALQHGFPGLRAGDRWCLCAARWHEAFVAGAAPQVVLRSTHERTLEHTTLEALMGRAIDLA